MYISNGPHLSDVCYDLLLRDHCLRRSQVADEDESLLGVKGLDFFFWAFCAYLVPLGRLQWSPAWKGPKYVTINKM